MRHSPFWLAVFPFCATVCAQPDLNLLNPPPHSQWGYALIDVKTDSVLSQGNSRQFLIPGSLLKLLTTGFALEKMGPARRFSTLLYQTGTVENGTLHGDLWIRGGGNPALGTEHGDTSQSSEAVFGLFTRALKKAGIRKIEGNVHGDAGLMEAEGPASGVLWEDVSNYYGAAPSGLCFHDNAYSVWLNASVNPPISVQGTEPRHIGVSRFQIRARDEGPEHGDSCFIFGAFWNMPRLITGSCPVEMQPLRIRGSLPDPAWTCARNFEDFLREHGIPVTGTNMGRSDDPLPTPVPLPKDTVRLAEHVSPPLIDLISVVHNKSDNLYAAQLLVLAGIESGAEHSSAGGLKALRKWVASQDSGDEPSRDLILVDGNGLSLKNQMTPAALTRRLADFTGKPWFPTWRETLIGGTSHPFRSIPYAEGLRGKLWVKTGSMSGVSALAGYMKTRSGRILAFSILVNHFDEPVAGVRDYWGPLLRSWQGRY